MSKPNEEAKPPEATSAELGTDELGADELQAVSGGLLLPAVQKVREAAARSSTSAESASFNFTKIES